MLKLRQSDIKKLEKYPKYSQDGKLWEAEVVLKVFNPNGKGTWYVLEAEKLSDNDYEFYGFVESPICEDFNEFGYFYLRSLSEVKVPIRVQDLLTGKVSTIWYSKLEIDRTLKNGTKLGEILGKLGYYMEAQENEC